MNKKLKRDVKATFEADPNKDSLRQNGGYYGIFRPKKKMKQ